VLLAGSLLAGPQALAAPMVVRFWDWGRTPSRDAFQYAALKLVLDKTTSGFGPYQLTRVRGDFSTLRVRREVSEGVHLNVQAGPWRPLDPNDPLDQRIPVNVPLMDGLLGYRFLLIRREDLPKFQAITSAAQLKAMTAGQGRGWTEVDLYRRNGYRVMDSADIKTLIPMLAEKRFDYFPMSVVEIDSALALYPALSSRLMVAPNLMISYPFPTIFYVSARHPTLARRLATGLVIAQKDGSLDELLHRHFHKELSAMAAVTRHFSIPSPDVPARLLRPLPLPGRSAAASH